MRTYRVQVIPDNPSCISNHYPTFDVKAESAEEAKAKAIPMAPVLKMGDVVVNNRAEIIDVEPDCCPTCMGLGVVPAGKGLEPQMAQAFVERFRRRG